MVHGVDKGGAGGVRTGDVVRVAADEIAESGRSTGRAVDGHGGFAVEVAVGHDAVVAAARGHLADEAAHSRFIRRDGHCQRDIAGSVAVVEHAGPLADETAEMDLVIVGGVAGYIAESIAVIGCHTVIHAVKSAGIDMVCVRNAADLDIGAAVYDRTAQHACRETADAAEALARFGAYFTGDCAVVDVNTVLARADEAAGVGLITGFYVYGDVLEVDVFKGHGLLAAVRSVIRSILAGCKSEQTGGHLIGGRSRAADGKAGYCISCAVIVSAEGICADLSLFAVDLAVERPADGLPLAVQGDISSLLEVNILPADVCVYRARQIAELSLIRDEVRILRRSAAAAEFVRVGCLVV